MKKNIFLISILTIACCLEAHCAHHTLDTMLVQLDTYLDNNKLYIEKKEKQISKCRQQLHSSTNDQQRYNASIELFYEYKSYKYDSAYSYANKSLHLAQKLNNHRYIVEANRGIVFCLLSSGLFKEAFDVIEKIDIDSIPQDERIEYYSLYSRLCYDIADFNQEEPFHSQYIAKGSIYSDSLISLLPSQSLKWQYATAQKQMKQRQYTDAIESFSQLLQRKDIDPHTEAIVSSSLGWLHYNHQKEFAMTYLIRAAIGDIRSATKETTALRVLASLLYEYGDIDRAYNYVRIALEDADFYNARHRKIEVSSILPIIEQDHFNIVKEQRNRLIWFVAIVSLLFLLLLVATLIIYKQVKKLRLARRTIEERNNQLQQSNNQLSEVNSQLSEVNSRVSEVNSQLSEVNSKLSEVNSQLSEVNKIKDEYIGYSFYINSEYIDKIENLYKMANRKIAARQYEDLRTSFKEVNLNKERDNMYASFDETFIKLFPTFIDSYNKLFAPEEQTRSSNDKSLTPEMRIFALIRLGICETERIAKFLNYSIHTINTYKTRVKNKSIVSNELFETKIMEIASVAR